MCIVQWGGKEHEILGVLREFENPSATRRVGQISVHLLVFLTTDTIQK